VRSVKLDLWRQAATTRFASIRPPIARHYAAADYPRPEEQQQSQIGFRMEGRRKVSRSLPMKGAYSGAGAIALLTTTTSLAAATGTASFELYSTACPQQWPAAHDLPRHHRQHTICRDINREAKPQKMPSGFNPAVGSTMPGKVQVYTMPAEVAKDVAAVKPYDYALVSKPYDFILHQKQVFLINPRTKKIVNIISR
jgi:hypothetical protein